MTIISSPREMPEGTARPIDLEAGRRAFIRTCGLGVAGAAVLGAAGLTTAAQAQDATAAKSANMDIAILNFALNLEYLEAEFYLMAAYGTSLSPNDTSGVGQVGDLFGGRQVQFKDPVIQAYAQELAADEQNHVQFLRTALGSLAVARPFIDLRNSFTVAARAAGLIGPNDIFDAYSDDNSFLLASYIFEDVGVTAYHGAAPLLTSKAYLAAAAGILAVEAYHAGFIRATLFTKGYFTQTALISQLRSKLDGTNNDDQGVGPFQSQTAGGPFTSANITPTDANGLAFSRSTRQVLDIVYGASGAAEGLFFPRGVNGAIKG